MSKHYFVQELHYGGVNINTQRVPFEVLEGNQAVIELDDEKENDKVFIQGLQSMVGTASIVRITKEEYDLKKNSFKLLPSGQPSQKEYLRVLQPSNLVPPKKDAAAVSQPRIIPDTPTKKVTEITLPPPSATPDLLDMAFKPTTGRPPAAAATVVR